MNNIKLSQPTWRVDNTNISYNATHKQLWQNNTTQHDFLKLKVYNSSELVPDRDNAELFSVERGLASSISGRSTSVGSRPADPVELMALICWPVTITTAYDSCFSS